MPSDLASALARDPRIALALGALRERIERFRAALTLAHERGCADLAARTAGADGRAEETARSLGAFAAGRIDARRFAELVAAPRALDPAVREQLARAVEVMRTLLGRGDELFVADVPSGGRLRLVVESALAEAGRAFGSAIAAELIRRDGFRIAEHEGLARSLGFASWTRAERGVAPPLVVTVDGADLHAGALADFMDGAQKIVLVVRGACAPAALARLITPGIFVAQSVDGAELPRAAAFDGPAAVALVPEGAARFVHDPAAGGEPWRRLAVTYVPDEAPRRLGGLSAWQQQDEVRHLRALAAPPPDAAAAVAPPAAGAEPADRADDPVGRLAAWILARADLSGLS